MITLTPQLALLAVITSGVGFAMIRLGLAEGALRLRNAKRRCPACGRFVEARTCSNCGS
jgi:rRNA maturation endonuclease Nob1